MGLRKGTPDPMAKKRSIYHEIGECSRMYTLASPLSAR